MLELKLLKLKNIGAIKYKEVVFDKGANLIDGENGKGKTTILKIIGLLLLNSYEGTLESILNSKSDDGFAELTFNNNNSEYVSSIKLNRDKKSVKSTKTLYKDGNVIANGEDVEKELHKIFPKTLTEYSLFNRQSGTKITTISDAERREILTQLCELDYSKQVKEVIESEVDNLKQIISDKEKEEYSLKNKQYNFGTEKEVMLEWNDENETKLIELKENQKQYEKNLELQKRITDLNSKLSNAENDLHKKESDYDVNKLQSQKEQELAQLKQVHELNIDSIESDYTNNKAKHEDNMFDLTNEINELTNQINDIKLMKIVKFNDDELTDTRTKYAELVTKSKIAYKNAELLSSGVCPTCGGSCNGKHDEFENEGKELEKQSIECEGVISDLENKKKEYETKKTENDNNKLLKEKLSSKLENLKQDLEREKDIYECLTVTVNSDNEKENNSYDKEVKNKISLYDEKIKLAEEAINNAKSNYESVKKELDSIEKPSDNLKDYTDEIKVYENNKQCYFEVISYNKAIRENNDKLKIEQETDKKNLEQIEKELFTLKDKLSDYKLSQELMLKTFPTWALEKVSENIVMEINNMIDTIYYKSLNIKFEPNKNSLKMTYNIDDGRDLSVLNLSGAEKNIVDLCVQSTFNKRQDLNAICLDECDNFCSNQTAEQFYNCLMELSNIYNQMIIITHKKEMKTRFIQNGCNVIKL